MKKKIAIALTTILWTATAAIASAAYVGNVQSMKFHNQGCRWEQKMNESNRTYFNSRGEAVSSGYVPCKVCRP
ncbi:Ada metal-binding domain-containing protein [Megasphaera sp. DISK 18]|uniref:Ada metal-binding domain-containing protein n=1 Tax=Megasphaera sp. DISK 18 TaxID=1776081 RepID=UPI000807042D|nr:Ada metal-binding domain-containing protein [Megasphaera sp. DISK 18]OBZ32231.1 hypothetical protein A0U42_11375 [Megasphaera sp. DISK 18]